MTDQTLFCIVVFLEAVIVALALIVGYQMRRLGRLRAHLRTQADAASELAISRHENDVLRAKVAELTEAREEAS